MVSPIFVVEVDQDAHGDSLGVTGLEQGQGFDHLKDGGQTSAVFNSTYLILR